MSDIKKIAVNNSEYYFKDELVRNSIGVASSNTSLGIAPLDENGKVPSANLPSYVDDVIEGYYSNGVFYNEQALTTQITPETGKIYVDLGANKTYRWSGSLYIVITDGVIGKDGASMLYKGTAVAHYSNFSSIPSGYSENDSYILDSSSTYSEIPVGGGDSLNGYSAPSVATYVNAPDHGWNVTKATVGDIYRVGNNLWQAQENNWVDMGSFKGTNGSNGTNGTNGTDGITPSISATATVNNSTGTPSVTVTKSGTDANPSFAFAFSNIKGDPGNAGVTGVKGDSESSYRTGNVNITPANIGLGNVDNTADADKSVAYANSAGNSKTVGGYDLYRFLIFGGKNVDYVTADFLDINLSQKAHQKYIEFWNGGTDCGWFNFKVGSVNAVDGGLMVNGNQVIHTGNISSYIPTSLPANGGNADTVDNYHASDFVKFYLSPLESGAPASSAKSWFTNTLPNSTAAIVYNVPGSEKTIIAGKSSGPYGHMLQLNYDDNYLRLLRYVGESWMSTDWEKISAGYADSAGSVAWGNVSDRPSSMPASDVYSWAKASTKPSYTASEVGISSSVQAITSNTSSSCSITGSNDGKSQTIIYTNSTSSDLTVTVPTTYKTPDGAAIEITCKAGGYCEVNYLNIDGTIYARGL